MNNPKKITCSQYIYDELSIKNWIASKRYYDPVTGTPWITDSAGQLLQERCDELSYEIKQYLKNNDQYFDELDTVQSITNDKWDKLFKDCDDKIVQKIKEYQQLHQLMLQKSYRLFFPYQNNDPDTPNYDLLWDEDLLLLLSSTNIPVFTFVGPSRCGKSTLLNDILGFSNRPIFQVSDSPDVAETKGAWIARYQLASTNNEEKKDDKKINQSNQTFYVIDMEGLSHQFTEFTEKVFYAIYLISDVIVWNDVTIGSDAFMRLMEKLKDTMKNIPLSSDKPSFLYLKRDKNKFFNFTPHKSFNQYINKHETFGSFRQLNLFSSIYGYRMDTRPSKHEPFSNNQLQNLIRAIFYCNTQGNIQNKTGSKFTSNFYELLKQLKYINKFGTISLATRIILNDEILQNFLLDSDDTQKMLLYAQKLNFDAERIDGEFAKGMKNIEPYIKANIIDDELQHALKKNCNDMKIKMKKYQDRLDSVHINNTFLYKPVAIVGGIAAIGTGIVGGTAGFLVGGAVDLLGGLVNKVTGTNIELKGIDIGIKTGVKLGAGLVMGPLKVIEYIGTEGVRQGINLTKKMKDNSFTRYLLAPNVSFVVKKELMKTESVQLFPGFSADEKSEELFFDEQLLSLVSSTVPIISFIGGRNINLSATLKELFNVSVDVNCISYDDMKQALIINMQNWKNDINTKKIFYSIYCISNFIIWLDTEEESAEFKQFEREMIKVSPNIQASKRKPPFMYIQCTQQDSNTKPTLQLSEENKAFAYQEVSTISPQTASTLILSIVNIIRDNYIKRFAEQVFGRGFLNVLYCSVCYQKLNTSISQCQYCGNLYFGDNYNNEYAFYRQLLYINKFVGLSFELQCIMESKIMKYFLYDSNDMYRELSMWSFAKRHYFKVKEICDEYLKEANYLEKYKSFAPQLQKGKEIMCSAISSIDYSWKWSCNEAKMDEEVEHKHEILKEEITEEKKDFYVCGGNENVIKALMNSKECLSVMVHYNEAMFSYKLVSKIEEWVNDDYLQLMSATRKEFGLTTKFDLFENLASDELIIDDIDDLKAAFQDDDSFPALTIHLHVKVNDVINNKVDVTVDQSRQKLKLWFENTVKLPEYYQIFIDEGIDDLNDVKILEKQDLIDMGIKKVGHRKRILHQINTLTEQQNDNVTEPVNAIYEEGHMLEDTVKD